jgi:hypothetical protein
MPPTSERAKPALGLTGSYTGALAGLPDRDNPLAWKRATREGSRGARELLKVLTDDELARYQSIASDQVHLEERLAALKVASAIVGAGVLILVGWHASAAGFGRWDIVGLCAGLAMGYWPWRVLKCRRMWQTHLDAARDEQTRRQTNPG